ASATFTDGQACGSASISSVVSTDGSCVVSTINGNNQFWDVALGGTYTITLSGVTECSGASMNGLLHDSAAGNIPATASGDGAGNYTFTVTLPSTGGCHTEIIEYCITDPGHPNSPEGPNANDALGGCVGHLRLTGDCDANSGNCGGQTPTGAC